MTLAIDTLAVLDELPDGTCVAYPVVEPQHVAVGSEGDVLAELRLFLADELASAPPHRIARYALPESAAAQTMEIRLPELELPERMRADASVPMTAIVIPHEGASWVLVPALRHVVYVSKGEALESTAIHEIERHLRAHAPNAAERLALLPPADTRVVPLRLLVDREGEAARGVARQKELLEARRRKEALAVLESVGTPLHALPDGPPVVGREDVVQTMHGLLGGRERRSVLLVGPERVGKSDVLRAWLRGPGRGRRAFATSGAQLMAGMSGLGQWQERLRRVVAAAEELDALLVFSDLTDLFDQTGKGNVDLPAALKPALEEGRVRVVGELTEAAADRLLGRHEGFFQSFQTVLVPTTDRKHGRRLLEARAAHAVEQGRPTVDEGALDAMLALAERYLAYRVFPGKAAELFDDVVAAFERPGVAAVDLDVVRASDVFRHFATTSGIPEALLRDDRALEPDRLRARFEARMVGQHAAVSAVVDTLCVVKAALAPGDKPLATFLFAGPTGVGKTELARALAEILYGADDRLVRFDMSEYADAWSARRLVDGDDGGDGLLTRKVREQPFSVILLDEIEKAHPSVFDLLLQVTGEGRLTDGRGRTAHFHNAILILTSNLGASHGARTLGIDARASADDPMDAIRKHFRPELVGRLDRVIPFLALGPEEIAHVTRLTVERVVQRRGLRDRGVALEVSEDALRVLATGGYDAVYGARALRRHVESALVSPLGDLLSSVGRVAAGSTVFVRSEDASPAEGARFQRASHGLVLELVVGETKVARADLRGLGDATTLRRDLAKWMATPAVEQVAEEVRSTLVQLAMPRSKAELARAGAELAHLQRELHRMGKPWEELQRRQNEVLELEELCFAAWLEGDTDGTLASWAEELPELRHRVRMALLATLVERTPRHAITVLCEELDEGRSLDGWLGPLLGDLGRRGWSATFHLHKDSTPSGEPWPTDRSFGPPRDADWMKAWLARPVRDRAIVLARIRGPHAGTLVTLETGLHRYLGVAPRTSGSHHRITLLALRDTIREGEWKHAALQPGAPPAPDKALKQQCRRWTDERPGQKLPPDYIPVPLTDYWLPHSYDELALRELLASEDPDVLFTGAAFGDEEDER
ncbi:MAG: ATP-dependent Clp protease ATP-binding subunit [Myxococcales bacterium]|nr:ATP-dependent Clp protease ATP-binding subunit [Myxococcales bacterium]